MLKLPLQLEHRWQATIIQLSEADIVHWGRTGQMVAICRPNGSEGRKGKDRKGRTLERDNLSVDAGVTNSVNHNSRRGRRLCSAGRYKLSPTQQQIRGTVRDVFRAGVLLESSPSYTTPALDSKDPTALSPAGIDDHERILNALVAKVRLRLSNRRKNEARITTAEPAQGERSEDLGESAAEPTVSYQKEERRGTRNEKFLKQKRRPCLECMGESSHEMRMAAIELALNCTQLRQLEEKILLLESVNVDTCKVLSLYPSILNCTIEKVKSVVDYLESTCGLKKRELGRVLSMTPQILGQCVDAHLQPAVNFLVREVGLSKKDLRKVINRCPRLLVASVDDQLRPTLVFLIGLGFTRMASVVSNNATLLTFSIQNKLLPKLRFLQNVGFSFDEAVNMVVRFPAIFNYGVEQNLQPKVDYLMNVMRYDLGELKHFPQYFGYSLDYRIRPRHEFLIERNIKLSLTSVLKLSDEKFYPRFKNAKLVQVDTAGVKQKLAPGLESQSSNHNSSALVPICV